MDRSTVDQFARVPVEVSGTDFAARIHIARDENGIGV